MNDGRLAADRDLGEIPGREDAEDWALLARAGERSALGTLFERHRDFVFRIAWSQVRDLELAEDVVQDVFVRLHQGHRRWRPRAAFRTWLYGVARNTARELTRRQRRDRAATFVDGGLAPSRVEAGVAGGIEGEAVAARDPVLGDLGPALDALPARQREAVVLRHLEGMSTAEAAVAMRLSKGSVKTHLHRALKALRESFSRTDVGDDHRRH